MIYQAEHKIKRAREYESMGMNLHAIQLYKTIIDEIPDFSEAHIRLAELYEKSNRIKPAFGVYKSALNLIKKDTELSITSSQFFIRHEFWRDALEALSEISPEEEPIVSFFMGFSYFNIEEYELSKIHLLKFVISDEQPELIHQACLYLAKIEYKFNQYEESLKFIRRAELLLNNYWELYFVKAKVLYQLKMYTRSSRAIKKALALNKNEKLVNLWAGRIYYKSSEYYEAEKNFLKYIEKEKSVSSETHLELSDVLQKQNKFAGALKHIETALSGDPENALFLERKKNLLEETN